MRFSSTMRIFNKSVVFLFIAFLIVSTRASHTVALIDAACLFELIEPMTFIRSTAYGAPEDQEQVVETGHVVQFVGQTPDDTHWLVDISGRVSSYVPVVIGLYAKTLLTDESFQAIVPGCEVPFWGLPQPDPLPLQDIISTHTSIGNWHESGIDGSGVRIGIIDSRFDTLELLLGNPENSSVVHERPVDGADSVGGTPPVEGLTAPYDHGTQALRVARAVAPGATFYVSRASSEMQLEAAVDALIAVDTNVHIIIYAAHGFTSEPDNAYRRVVRRASDNGVLWVNAAGNLGAGYYTDIYNGTELSQVFHHFDDPNRTLSQQRTLMVPLNPRGAQITLTWEQQLADDPDSTQIYENGLPVGPRVHLNDLDLIVYAHPNTEAGGFIVSGVEDGNQLIGLPAYESSIVGTDQAGMFRDFTGIPYTLDAGQPLPMVLSNDMLPDNEVYIYVGRTVSAAPREGNANIVEGTRFELYVENALSPDFDPSIQTALAPVVPVPAELPESLTVGAYDRITNEIAWYSGRTNERQLLNGGALKPDIATFGEILVSTENGNTELFLGTSAAAPLAGAVAALIADKLWTTEAMDSDFDPVQVRTLITERATSCLDNGAAGFQLRRLDLPELSALASGEPLRCNIDPESVTDISAQDEQNRQWVEFSLDLQPDSTISGTQFDISGAAAGLGFTSYLLDIASVGQDDSVRPFVVLEDFIQDPEAYPELDVINVCDLDERARQSESVRAGGRLVSFDSTKYPDGDYFLRLRMCIHGHEVESDAISFKIDNEGDPTIELLEPSLENLEILENEVLELRGLAYGRGATHYVIQVKPVGIDSETWMNLVPNSGESMEEDACAVTVEHTDHGKINGVKDVRYLGLLEADQFDDGSYSIRALLCSNADVLAQDEVTSFTVDLKPAPFLQITSPQPNAVVNSDFNVVGEVGGEGFQRFILQLVKVGGDERDITTLVPPSRSSNAADICASSLASVGTSEILGPNRVLHSFQFTDYEPGDYQLKGFVCVDGVIAELGPESVASVPLTLAERIIVDTVVELEEPQEALIGFDALRGIAQSPFMEQYVIQIARVNTEELRDSILQNDDTAHWTTLVPQLPADQEQEITLDFLCRRPPVPGAVGTANRDNDVLVRFNTEDFENGTYIARIRLCLSDTPEDSEGLLIEDHVQFEILNEYQIDLKSPREGAPLTGDVSLIGVIRGQGIQQYTIELEPVDDLPDSVWQTVVGPSYDGEERSTVDLCTLEPNSTGQYGTTEVEQVGLLAPLLQSAAFADGEWRIRIRVCNDFSTVAEKVFGPFVISNNIPIPLSLELNSLDPEGLTEVTDTLVIRGTARGDLYRGYVVSIAPTTATPQWIALFPTALRGPTPREGDVCSDSGLPEAMPPVIDGVLYTLSSENYPGGDYQLRLTLCAENLEGHIVDYAEVVRSIRILNDSFVSEFDITEVGNRFHFVGTISSPSLSQYIVQVAPSFDAPAIWQTIVGPTPLADDSELCATPMVRGTLGTYAVSEGTVAVLNAELFSENVYDVLLTICLDNGGAYQELQPGRLIIAGGPSNRPSSTTSMQASSLAASEIEVRGGPSSQYPILGQLEPGVAATILGRSEDSGWLNVTGENFTSGWVEVGRVAVHSSGFNIDMDLPIIAAPPLPQAVGGVQPQRVLYASDHSGSWQIYRLETSGQSTQLTTDGNNEFPSISPQGDQVAFASDRDGNREIYLMNLDGSGQVNVTNSTSEDYRPVWSPDSKTLLFESNRSGLRNAFALQVTTGETTQLTQDSGSVCCVSWSSNNQYIAYAANGGGDYEIYTVDLESGQTSNLSANGGSDINPEWQPSGNMIVFQSNRSGNWEIYRVQVDGSGLVQLTDTESADTEPVWLNRNEIAFSSDRLGNFAIFVMSLNGQNERLLIDSIGADAQPEMILP